MPSRPADLRECGDWWNDTAYATDAAVSVSWGEEYKTITAFQLVAPRYCITGRLLLSVRPRVSCCSMMGKRPGCPWMVLPSDSTDISSNNCSFARKTSHCIRACCCSCLSGCVLAGFLFACLEHAQFKKNQEVRSERGYRPHLLC